MRSVSRGFLTGGCAALILACGAAADLSAAIVNGTNIPDNMTHSMDPNVSPFFTASADGLQTFVAANGWAPITPAQAATVGSITTAKAFSIVGNATAANGWVDGNKIPTGMVLTFNAQFTFSAIGQPYLTTPGNSVGTGGTLGRGIGITFQSGATGLDDIDPNEGISVSAVTVSNVSYTGTPSDPNFTFTPGSGTVSNFGTRVFRSNNFAEGTAGMLLTNQAGDTIGFGTASGTLASGLAIDNGFVAGTFDSFRQTTPYTLVVTQGVSVIKGIGMAYDVSYDIQPAPEPSTALLAVGGLATAAMGRRRFRV
jgi:hypothetical protein